MEMGTEIERDTRDKHVVSQVACLVTNITHAPLPVVSRRGEHFRECIRRPQAANHALGEWVQATLAPGMLAGRL